MPEEEKITKTAHIDNSPSFITVLSSDITFKTLTDETFSKQAEIAQGVFLLVEKDVGGNKEPIAKLVKGALELEWGPMCPFSDSCLEVIGEAAIGNEGTTCHKACSKMAVQVDSEHGKVKETCIFSEKPPTNVMRYIIAATGLTPDPLHLVAADQYLHINWKDNDNDIQFCWPTPIIWDDAGSKTHGFYKIVSPTEIQIIIDQEWLDNSTGKIHVDPTGTIYSSGPNGSFGNNGRDHNFIYNGTRFAVFYSDLGSQQRTYIATVPTDPGSNWASSANPITGSYYMNCHSMADNDQVFIGVSITGTTAKSAILDAGGSWSGTTNITGFSNHFQDQFDSCVGDDGNIWLLAKTSTTAFELSMSDDKGATWNAFGTYTDPTILLSNSLQGAFGIEPLDANRLMLVSLNSSGHVIAQIYTIDTDTWASPVTIKTSPASANTSKWQMHRDSNGDMICLFCSASSEFWAHYNEGTDTWTNGTILGTGYSAFFCSVLTDDDKIVVGDSSGFNNRAKWATTADLTTWTNVSLGAASAKGVHAYKGGPAVPNQHNILFNAVVGSASVCVENESYQTIAGGDTSPPTGGDITVPLDTATNVSIMPTITVASWADDTTPISGQVQIDTVASFDSASLQESAWTVLSESGGTWGGDFSSWSALDTVTLYYMRTRARDAVEPPNVSDWTAAKSFTTGGWIYLGMDQPNIVYGGSPEVTIYFPIPIRVIATKLSSGNKINQALDKSVEVIGSSYPTELKIIMTPVMDAAFDAAMVTFYEDWGGQRLWFDFTSGVDTRYDGYWLLKPGEWRPRPSGGYKKYDFTLERPNDG